MEKLKLTQAQINAVNAALDHYNGDADTLLVHHRNLMADFGEWKLWPELNTLNASQLRQVLAGYYEMQNPVLLTVKQEHKLNSILRAFSKKELLKEVPKFAKYVGTKTEKFIQALHSGYQIKPGSLKVKYFRDIELGMVLMDNKTGAQHRIEQWTSIGGYVGIRLDDYAERGMHLYYFADYGKTWWIVGDQYDESGGVLQQSVKSTYRGEVMQPVPQRIVPIEQRKQMLQADIDYQLASLHDAMQREDQVEIAKCKDLLVELAASRNKM